LPVNGFPDGSGAETLGCPDVVVVVGSEGSDVSERWLTPTSWVGAREPQAVDTSTAPVKAAVKVMT